MKALAKRDDNVITRLPDYVYVCVCMCVCLCVCTCKVCTYLRTCKLIANAIIYCVCALVCVCVCVCLCVSHMNTSIIYKSKCACKCYVRYNILPFIFFSFLTFSLYPPFFSIFRYLILRSCLLELMDKQIISPKSNISQSFPTDKIVNFNADCGTPINGRSKARLNDFF